MAEKKLEQREDLIPNTDVEPSFVQVTEVLADFHRSLLKEGFVIESAELFMRSDGSAKYVVETHIPATSNKES